MVRCNDTIKGTDGVLATPRLIDGGRRVHRLRRHRPGRPRPDQWPVGTPAAGRRLAGYRGRRRGPLGLRLLPAHRPGLGRGRHPPRRRRQRHASPAAPATRSSTATSTSPRGSAPHQPGRPATETGTTDLMENKAVPATAVNPCGPGNRRDDAAAGRLRRSRRPGQPGRRPRDQDRTPPDTAAVDTAVFSAARASYTITRERQRQHHGRQQRWCRRCRHRLERRAAAVQRHHGEHRACTDCLGHCGCSRLR